MFNKSFDLLHHNPNSFYKPNLQQKFENSLSLLEKKIMKKWYELWDGRKLWVQNVDNVIHLSQSIAIEKMKIFTLIIQQANKINRWKCKTINKASSKENP